MALVEVADFRRIDHAAYAKNVLGRGAEPLREALKGRGNGAIVGFHVEAFDFGSLGKAERVGRIGPGDESIRICRLSGLDHRSVILRSEWIRFVVDNVKTGFLEERSPRIGELDAEVVADIDDGDFVADLTSILQLLKHADRALGVGRG